MPRQQSQPYTQATFLDMSLDEPEMALADIAMLRTKVIELWHERAVTLTPEEQCLLAKEMAETAALFHDLVASS